MNGLSPYDIVVILAYYGLIIMIGVYLEMPTGKGKSDDLFMLR